jgi:hypothetical protein
VRGLDGSRWNVRSLEMRDGELSMISAAGFRGSLPFEELAMLDYSVANLTFLSNLEPESVDWRPHLLSATTPVSVSRWFRPRVDPQPCALRGTQFEHGLSLHSRTQLTYRLQPEFRRFRATVGIDDRYRDTGQVRLVVTANQRVLFDGQIAGADPPLELDLELNAARRLSILVDFGSDGTDLGDHLVLGNPRLTK